ncbi:uncharacterized protein LOC113360246 [Papaver somniferum]|uniref:uncharacterized protein LOC113360246 n=1 Tax=Papaver somniferum TaxID=3469 RepID=UPI000E7003BB|nr:uncharacterized protein LOC113360246 [Papaver somniferum]
MSCKQIIAGWLAEKGNYEVFKMGSCLMWALWKNINDKIFNCRNHSIQSIIKEAVFWFNYSSPVLPEEELQTYTNQHSASATEWKLPKANWTKLNVDAAYDNFNAGWAVVARDPDASFKGCGTKSREVLSPIEVETRAVLLAVEFSEVMGLQRVIIKSDAEKVIKMLTKEHANIPWRLREPILRIQAQTRKLTEVKFTFITRDGNNVVLL